MKRNFETEISGVKACELLWRLSKFRVENRLKLFSTHSSGKDRWVPPPPSPPSSVWPEKCPKNIRSLHKDSRWTCGILGLSVLCFLHDCCSSVSHSQTSSAIQVSADMCALQIDNLRRNLKRSETQRNALSLSECRVS